MLNEESLMNTKIIGIKILLICFVLFHWGCVTTSDSDNPPQGTPGTLKWAFETEGSIFSSPAMGVDGTIYVGNKGWNLYAINPDGTEKWVFPALYWVLSSPAVEKDGTVYVGSIDLRVYAINPDSTEKWTFKTWMGVYSSTLTTLK